MNNIRVMLADDHAVVRMGFCLLLKSTEDMEVVAEVGSGEEACRLYPEVKPDVVVMDISMPGIGGFDALTRILAKDAAAKILVLSAHEDTIHPSRVLHAGALGYLTKRGAPEELIGAIRQVANGKTFVEAARPADGREAHHWSAESSRFVDGQGVQRVPRARAGPLSERDCGYPVAVGKHGRHTCIQHQAEAGGGELRRARADRDSQ
jgi:DNA-binding NarL/FixJ family response regulator